jgi:ACS family glucarate transporter-like MFS transporter
MNATAAVDAHQRTKVRWLIIFFLFLITTINYADRASFSIAGQAASKELGLDPISMGYILSAFAWSYTVAQLPGGALLDRYGSKTIYLVALILWSSFTAFQGFAGFLTGFAAAAFLFAMRFMMGIAEAPSFPANARIVAAWFPTSERGTASAIFNSAQYFSLVAFAPLMGWLVHEFGWQSVFYVMGSLGFIAAIGFARLIHGPNNHPKINQAEYDYIQAGGAVVDLEATTAERAPFTWHNVRQVLANRMFIGIYLAQYCIITLTYFFTTWFPIYLVQERGLSILQAGFAAALPALSGFVGGLLGGYISDAILKRTGSLTWARKIPILAGMLLSTSIIMCNYVDEQWLVLTIMALSFFGKGIGSLGWAVMSDTSPKQLAGVAGGVFNTFGNSAGIVTPIVIGYIVAGTGSFEWALIYVGVHCVVAVLSYLFIVGEIKRLQLEPDLTAAPASSNPSSN